MRKSQSEPAIGVLSFTERNPVLLAAFAFMAGILLAKLDWRPAGWAVFLIGAASAAALFFCWRLRRLAVAIALVAALGLGMLDAQLAAEAQGRQPSLSAYANGLLYTITGSVARSGAARKTEEGKSIQTVDVAVEMVDRYGEVRRFSSASALPAMRLTVIEAPGEQLLAYGARVQFDAQLHEAQVFHDPGVWNRRQWLAEQGITALASLPRARIETLPGFGGTSLGYWRDRARKSLLAHLHSLGAANSRYGWMALSEGDVGLLEAMMLGERSDLDNSDKLDFQRTGSFHLLVVSGMNIAIFAVVIFWAMRKLPFGDVAASVLTAGFALSYAALTEMGAPVMRAVIMAIVFLTARLFYRTGASLNAIGTGALLVLAWTPSALFEASFQMTFLSVFAILTIASPLMESTSVKYARGLRQLGNVNFDFTLAREVAQFRLDLRLIGGRLQRVFRSPRIARAILLLPLRLIFTVASLLILSFIMQCVMALPTALYFHRVTTTAIAANSVVVPLMEALMPLVMISLAASYVSAWLATAPVALTALALHGISRTIGLLGSAKFAEVRVADPRLWVGGVIALAFLYAWWVCARGKLRWMLSGVAALALTAALLALPRHLGRSNALEVTAIDVGQGDALLVITPEGKALLIDSGGAVGGAGESSAAARAFDYGEQVVSPYLWSRGIDHLDAVAISHGHSDHMQGMPSVVRNFHPREVWQGLMPNSPLYEQVLAAARASRAKIVDYREDDHIHFGGTEIAVLAPARDAQPGSAASNDDSLSLYLSYGKAAALLSGDAEHAAEARIATHSPRAQLLKVDHHGSLTSTDAGLLRAVQPQFAVISVGTQNRFGHPRREVLERLGAAHVRTWRTDTTGAVTFMLSADGGVAVK